MADDIQRWSEELARDPTSKVFVPLADALRRRGQLDLARKVVTRGLEKHPREGDAHDVMARIWADRGETERAVEQWEIALECAPRHPGALKGLAFAHFQAGRLAEAERMLVEAVAADPDDASIRAAVVRVRRALGMPDSPALEPSRATPTWSSASAKDTHSEAIPPTPVDAAPLAINPADAAPAATTPADPTPDEGETAVGDATRDEAPGVADGTDLQPAPTVVPGEDEQQSDGFNPVAGARQLFADFLGNGEQTALLLDGQGLVVAGTYFVADGRDVAEQVGAALSGVSDEATRAMRHLELGGWTSIVFETDATTVAMGPLSNGGLAEDGVALVAAARSVPLGFVRRLLRRVSDRGATWLGSVNAGAGGQS